MKICEGVSTTVVKPSFFFFFFKVEKNQFNSWSMMEVCSGNKYISSKGTLWTNKNGRGTEQHLPKTVFYSWGRSLWFGCYIHFCFVSSLYVLAMPTLGLTTLSSVVGKCRSVPLPFLFVSCLSRFSLYYKRYFMR